MAEWTTVTDYDERARDRMLSQWREAPRIQSLLEAAAACCQTLEGEIDDLITQRTLANATGDNLDQYGNLIGEQRLGLTDDEYRVIIAARILINNSESTADDVFAIFKQLLNEVNPPTTATVFDYQEYYPKLVCMRAHRETAISDVFAGRVSVMMELARPIGTAFLLTEAPSGYLGWSGAWGTATWARVL